MKVKQIIYVLLLIPLHIILQLISIQLMLKLTSDLILPLAKTSNGLINLIILGFPHHLGIIIGAIPICLLIVFLFKKKPVIICSICVILGYLLMMGVNVELSNKDFVFVLIKDSFFMILIPIAITYWLSYKSFFNRNNEKISLKKP